MRFFGSNAKLARRGFQSVSICFNGYTRGTPLESDICAGTDETFGGMVKTVFKLLSSQFYKAAGIEEKNDRTWHQDKDVP